MMERLPIRRTQGFQSDMQNLIPKNKRKNLIYDLAHITQDDLSRHYNLKSPTLAHFRSYHKWNFRILFVYCSQCFHQFNRPINCQGCDENDLEKIVLISIDHRSNAYRDNRTEFIILDE